MLRMSWTAVALVMLGVMMSVTGCGGGNDSGLNTVPVTGTVMMDGSPVEGAKVAFIPKEGGQGAVGMTDAQGKFSLMTVDPDDGAVPGSYTVTVFKSESAQSMPADADRANMSGEEARAYAQEVQKNLISNRGGAGKVQDLLPEKYKSPATTDLTAEVTEGGENNFAFELKK